MTDMHALLIAEGTLLFIVILLLPFCAVFWAKRADKSGIELKGLALPKGSVRSMLALVVVGSLVIFLVFGAAAMPEKMESRFTEIVAALTGIAGTIIGFYFGSGGSGSAGSGGAGSGDERSGGGEPEISEENTNKANIPSNNSP